MKRTYYNSFTKKITTDHVNISSLILLVEKNGEQPYVSTQYTPLNDEKRVTIKEYITDTSDESVYEAINKLQDIINKNELSPENKMRGIMDKLCSDDNKHLSDEAKAIIASRKQMDEDNMNVVCNAKYECVNHQSAIDFTNFNELRYVYRATGNPVVNFKGANGNHVPAEKKEKIYDAKYFAAINNVYMSNSRNGNTMVCIIFNILDDEGTCIGDIIKYCLLNSHDAISKANDFLQSLGLGLPMMPYSVCTELDEKGCYLYHSNNLQWLQQSNKLKYVYYEVCVEQDAKTEFYDISSVKIIDVYRGRTGIMASDIDALTQIIANDVRAQIESQVRLEMYNRSQNIPTDAPSSAFNGAHVY